MQRSPRRDDTPEIHRRTWPSGRAFLLLAAAAGASGCVEAVDVDSVGQAVTGYYWDTEILENLEVPFTPNGPAVMVTADFDRDGAADVAVLPQYGTGVIALQQPGGGALTLANVSLPTSGARHAVAGDLDRDGDTDLVVTCGPCAAGDQPRVLDNQWAQTGRVEMLARPLPIWGGAASAVGPVVLTDIDGDRDLDVFAFSTLPWEPSVMLETQPGLWFQDVSWRFDSYLGEVTGATVADLMGDGTGDIYVVRPGVDALLMIYPGTYYVREEGGWWGLWNDRGEVSASAGDLDRDGDDEIVTLAQDGRARMVDFQGWFGEWDIPEPPVSAPVGIAVAELTGDGWPDLVITSADEEPRVVPLVTYPGSPPVVDNLSLAIEVASGAASGPASTVSLRPGRAAAIVPAAFGRSWLYTSDTTDRDCDDAPDSAEDLYGLSYDDPADADRDHDGDDVPSRIELLLGSDPFDGDTDVDQLGDSTDQQARLDVDGDGLRGAHDNCPDDVNPGRADLDGDWIGDACDDDLLGDGQRLALRTIAVAEAPGMPEVAAYDLRFRDLKRFTDDLRGRLPTGETFRLLSGPLPMGGTAYIPMEHTTRELVEVYDPITGDHAYEAVGPGGEPTLWGYQRLGSLGWVVVQPLPELGMVHSLRHLVRYGIDPFTGGPRVDHAITADPGFAGDLLFAGYFELEPLGFVAADEGYLSATTAVVRYHRDVDTSDTLHSTAISGEGTLEAYRSEGEVFSVWRHRNGHTVPLYRLRDANGRELLVSNADERAQLLGSRVYVRDTMIGHVLRPEAAHTTIFEGLVPLVRFDRSSTERIYTTDPEEIRTLGRKHVPMTLLGWVIPHRTPEASCPSTPKRDAIAASLYAITDPEARAVATLIGLTTACALDRVLRGDPQDDIDFELAAMVAAKSDPYGRDRLAEVVQDWRALDSGDRAALLGGYAAYDPGDCTQALDPGLRDDLSHTMGLVIPSTPASLRAPQCEGTSYAAGAEAARAARAVVTVPRVQTSNLNEFQRYVDTSPSLFGVIDQEAVRGHSILEQFAAQHPSIGLPTHGLATNLSCSAQNPCDASQGLRCVQGTCMAHPIVKSGAAISLSGINLWDPIDGEIRLRRVTPNGLVPVAPVEFSSAHVAALVADDARCAPEPTRPPFTHQDAVDRARLDGPIEGPGHFYELVAVNKNGNFFKPGEPIPTNQEPALQRELGRTVHVCWSGWVPPPGTNTSCTVPSSTVASCLVQDDVGPDCGGGAGGVFATPPRPLSECTNGSCGETPNEFVSESERHFIFVEDKPPIVSVHSAVSGVYCGDETGDDWPGDDELVAIMGVIGGAQPPGGVQWNEISKRTGIWSGDFDTGERWVERDRRGGALRTRIDLAPRGIVGDTAAYLVQVAEYDDNTAAIIVGDILIGAVGVVAAILVPPAAPIIGIGTVAIGAAYTAWMESLGEDDPIGSSAWTATVSDVTDRGNQTHDGVLDPVAELTTIPGGFNVNLAFAAASIHPSVDAWGYDENTQIQACTSSCASGFVCHQGACVPQDWKDASLPEGAMHSGFVEKRRFLSNEDDLSYDFFFRYFTAAP
jgi:hypothetical protein